MAYDDWSMDISDVPLGVKVIVTNKMMQDVWAEYDPAWGGGRGAWFDAKGKMLTGIWRWNRNSQAFVDWLRETYPAGRRREFLAGYARDLIDNSP